MSSKTFIRRADRRAVDMRGFALGPNRDSDVAITDLSYGGCQLRSSDKFAKGEVIELRIMKVGAAAAEIRWTGESCAGARFLN